MKDNHIFHGDLIGNLAENKGNPFMKLGILNVHPIK